MPVPLPFEAWRHFTPVEAAQEVHRRIAALPAPLRGAALAWIRPEPGLAAELERPAKPDRGLPPLRGIPYLLKDLFDVAGVPTRAGSSFLATVRPTPGDSTLVRRLRDCGAALAGKTHLVEFAAGLTGENRTYGDCPHPFIPDRLSGGSSSGSAALVAVGVVPFAIGTDTGGSVRVPAAFCGLHGYRGVPGHEHIRDAVPLSPTCDTAGWFTAGAADLREILNALIGPPAPHARAPRGVFLRARDLLPDAPADLDDACAAAAARHAAPADAATRETLRNDWRDTVDTYATLVMHDAHAIHRAWLEPHRADYDPAIWQRFHDAGSITPEALAAAGTAQARLRESFARFFETWDFLVLPSAPFPALTKAQCTPAARRAMLTFTAPASVGGLPCVCLPVPLGGGLSAGLQVLARKPDSAAFDFVLQTEQARGV